MSHGAGRARLQLTPPAGLSPTQVMTEREILIKAVDRAVAQGWLGIRDEGYRYDGVVLHQGTVRVNASRLDSKSWLFNHPDRMLLSEEFAEAFFGSDPHQWIALVHCARCWVDLLIRVHRHRVLLAVPPGPTPAGSSTPQISGRVSLMLPIAHCSRPAFPNFPQLSHPRFPLPSPMPNARLRITDYKLCRLSGSPS